MQHSPHARPLAAPRRLAGRKGSALVLAMVTVIMLVMMGAAYLQVARTDLRTAMAVDTRANVDNGSILRYIGGILAGDVPEDVDSTEPEYFDYPHSILPAGAAPGSRFPNPPTTNTGWWLVPDLFAPTVVPGARPNLTPTNANIPPDQSAREPRASGDLPDAAGNIYAHGGLDDDPWLASTEPDFDNLKNYGSPAVSVAYWPHITDLSGVFLDLNPAPGALEPHPGTGNGAYPQQYLSTADGTATGAAGDIKSGVNYAVPAVPTGDLAAGDEFVFADADGDGIVDSRWTWAPLPSDGGQAFIMAVRIVDNSAMIDLNTWAWHRAAVEPSRWQSPGDIDLNEPILGVLADAGAGSLTALNIFNARDMGGGIPSAEDTLFNWLDAGAVWRNINGANAASLADWASIGTDMETRGILFGQELRTNPNLTYKRFALRQEEIELRWRNGLNRSSDNTTVDPATTLEALDPALFRSNDLETRYIHSPYATVQSFFQQEPRKQITTASGSADAGRLNLNDATVAELSDAFEDSISSNRPTLFARMGFNAGSDDAMFADQLAALVADFRDDDSELTEVNGMYGMEQLPFISEVYVQFRYGTPTVGGGPSPADWTVAWDSDPDDFAAAIVLVNPFPTPIEIPDVELWVGTQRWGNLQDLMAPVADGTLGPVYMEANEQITLTRREGGAGSDNTNLPNNGNNDATADQRVVDVTATPAADWPNGDGSATLIDIELRAKQANTGLYNVPYQRFVTETLRSDIIDTYDGALPAAPIAPTSGHYQGFTKATANELSIIAVDGRDDAPAIGGDLTTEHVSEPAMLGTTASVGDVRVQPTTPFTITTPTYFDATKGNATLDNLVVNPNGEPWLIGNADRFYRTGDLLRIIMIGPRNNGGTVESVGEVWKQRYTSFDINDLMLDLNDPQKVDNGGGGGGRLTFTNHAQFYLQRFTTMNVNNGDGGLVAGRPNINTMPRRHLARLLPTTIAAAANTIADAIVKERLDQNGIPFVSTLADFQGPSLTGPESLSVYDPAGNTSNAVVDFNELDQRSGAGGLGGPAGHGLDGRAGDIEEKTMLMTYLNQVVSTRSDIFTAYVLVRSYPANDFSAGTPIDEYRLIAIFDRSTVNGNGLPRILAVKRFADTP